MKTKRSILQVGCDCHREFSRITARDHQGRIVWRQRLRHADRLELREQLGSWPKGIPVILEGTFGWGWLSDEMLAAGLDPHLASSTKVAAWRKARGLPKSDRTDADLLSELWTQQPRWWEVWLAPPEVRHQRQWLRYRMSLVKMQTALKNRTHAVLHRHGLIHGFSDLFGASGRRYLSLLIVAKDAPLPDSARATLKGYLQLLDHLRRQIASATRSFRGQVHRSPAARRLMTLPGISWILSYTILAEIGRHVGHVGRRTLKWAWIEAGHGAVRKGGRFREIFDRRTDGGKRDRNRGYIAVAHELCRIAYVLWNKEIDYNPNRPARPGWQKKAKKKSMKKTKPQRSRPGKGQPDRPMVVAAV